MAEFTVVVPEYFKDVAFICFKLAPYLPPRSTLTYYGGLGDRVLQKVAKDLVLKLTKIKDVRKTSDSPLIAFWDGVDPMVKKTIIKHFKSKDCVRVIRFDDEENVAWMIRNANSAEPYQPIRSL